MSCKPRYLNKFVSFIGVTLGGTFSFSSICLYKGDETFYSKFFMPLVCKFVDPELAHQACIFMTRNGLIKCSDSLTHGQSVKLNTKLFSIDFNNPIGIAAGFDKNCSSLPGVANYGAGFIEVGTVTPMPQDGNPKKRIFRINSMKALINRCGFNNLGIKHAASQLDALDKQSYHPMIIGLNIGKNKTSAEDSSDYLTCLQELKPTDSVDYIVVNISSPNTPGLRDLQHKKNLESLVQDILKLMHEKCINKPLLIKIAPDLSDSQLKDIADVVLKKKVGNKKVDGVILTNTTVSRPNTNTNFIEVDPLLNEQGGLSGLPIQDKSTHFIRKFYSLTNGKVPIIGVGGIFSGHDAYEKIKAGASLVQLYTSLTYEGPPIVNRIKRELVTLLEQDKLDSIQQAVGLDHRK